MNYREGRGTALRKVITKGCDFGHKFERSLNSINGKGGTGSDKPTAAVVPRLMGSKSHVTSLGLGAASLFYTN